MTNLAFPHSYKPSQKELDYLELQVNHAYNSLLISNEVDDLAVAKHTNMLYEAIDSLIQNITGFGLRSIKGWNRGTQRTDLLDRYVLQAIIGSSLSEYFVKDKHFVRCPSYSNWRTENPPILGRRDNDPTEEDLIRSIEIKKGKYEQIDRIVNRMAFLGEYDTLLRAMENIRQFYPYKPN